MDPGSGQKYTFILTPSAPLGVQRTAETQYVMLDKNINPIHTGLFGAKLCRGGADLPPPTNHGL